MLTPTEYLGDQLWKSPTGMVATQAGLMPTIRNFACMVPLVIANVTFHNEAVEFVSCLVNHEIICYVPNLAIIERLIIALISQNKNKTPIFFMKLSSKYYMESYFF